jgi:hypothetical protein
LSIAYGQTRVALGDTFSQAVAGAAYQFGRTRLTAMLIEARYGSAAGGPRRQTVYSFGTEVKIGVGLAHVSFVRGDMSGGAPGSGYSSADGAQQLEAGYVHNLSLRTALYATASRLGNRGASRLVVDVGNSGMRSGERSIGIEAGLRHIF